MSGPRTPSDAAVCVQPSPCTMALQDKTFRAALKTYVLDLPAPTRQRGIFCVTLLVDPTAGGSGSDIAVNVTYVTIREAESGVHKTLNYMLSAQPSMRSYLRNYDPRKEFLILAAFVVDPKAAREGDIASLAGQVCQVSSIT